MSILSKVTWKSMWRNPTRTLVTIVGIILSAAMFTAVTTMVASVWDFIIRGEIYTSGDYFIQFDDVDEETASTLHKDDRVSQIARYDCFGYVGLTSDDNRTTSFALNSVDEPFLRTMPVHLTQGRLPEHSGELVVCQSIYDTMYHLGLIRQLGDPVTLTYQDGLDSADVQSYKATYTIVGIMEQEDFGFWKDPTAAVTLYDENSPAPVVQRLYVKTHNARDAYAVAEDSGSQQYDYNSTLMAYYGVTVYSNYTAAIFFFVFILFAIIMVGSVSLIYNAFSISVSERTKQFGLLSSIGATRRQLRHSVLFEALCLCAIGIPLGLFAGWAGIAITIHAVGGVLNRIGVLGNTVPFQVVLSWQALAVGGITAALTVLLSALLPARRATRVAPLAAIRQSNDYKVPRQNIRMGKLTYKVFGLPGIMAKKYYRVSRKKYRATIVSLTVSVVLFICAATYTGALQASVDSTVNVENFDLYCFVDPNQRKALEEIRSHPSVAQSVYYESETYYSFVPLSELDEVSRNAMAEISHNRDIDMECRYLEVIYLEDDAFFDYLAQQNIEAGPYMDFANPTLLVCNQTLTSHHMQTDSGTWERHSYDVSPVPTEAETVQIVPTSIPSYLITPLLGDPAFANYEYVTLDGKLYLRAWPVYDLGNGSLEEDPESAIYFQVVQVSDDQGQQILLFYPLDPVTGEITGEPLVPDQPITLPAFTLGARIDVLPFGISSDAQTDFYGWTAIAPLSAKSQLDGCGKLAMRAADYPTLRALLDQWDSSQWVDFLAAEETSRNLMLLINVFSYGFIILISLICAANVFNTISTNIALRRRDFGMLRSVGLKHRELYRMMNYECLIYGTRSLLFGLPLGIWLSLQIQHSTLESITNIRSAIPWTAVGIAVGSVFVVVFASMLYAVTKLRKDNPIDAIRAENL